MDSSSDYGKGLAENFIKTFEAGASSLHRSLMAGDTDFNSSLPR